MNTSDSFVGHSRLIRLALLLITAILAITLVACDGSDTCQLSVSSTSGGSVTSPGDGDFNYETGIVVELVATPDDGYEFQAWTGDTEDITDPNSASTNITINGSCSITAEFVEEGGPSPSQPY